MKKAHEKINMKDPLEVQTNSFILKTMKRVDVTDEYVSWWNDEEIQSKLGSKPRGWTRVQAVRYIEQFDNRWKFHLGIFDKITNKLIGFTSILSNPVTKVTISNRVIGDRAFWRTGVSKELSAWTIPFAFEQLGMEKIKAEIKGQNAASIALCEYLGFTRECVLRSESPANNGERLDVYVYALLRGEWQQRKNQLTDQ